MLRAAFVLWFGLLTLPLATFLNAQPMPQAAAQLAARISSLLPRRSVASLDLDNQSTLPPGEWSNFRIQLEADLRKAGIEVTAPSSPDPRVRITLTENPRGLLFVADISSGDSRQIAMLPWNPPALGESQPRVTFTRKPLLIQPEPILDVLLLNSNSQMLVLTSSLITSYNLSGNTWTPRASVSLVLPRPVPRDPRGRLEATPAGFRVYLPGTTCVGAIQPNLTATCAPWNETWADAQVRWVTDSNVLESDAVKGPFYSTAAGVFEMADGHATTPDSWGSDIVAVDSACGTAIIATSTATDRDSVRVYQNTAPVSDPLPLPGPVTALWPAEARGEATLVVHNLQTGEYEASRLGLACSQ
jgi:hypothetical protein